MKQNATALFDRVGTRGWRDSGHFTFTVTSRALRGWIADRLPASPRTILSIGCGGGELERRLTDAGHRVVGIDTSLPMLRSARRRRMTMAVLGDAQRLPFASARFDVVLLCEAIGYFDLDRAFGEAGRVLKPGGRLLITTYLPHIEAHALYHKYGDDEMAAPLVYAGFRVAARRFIRTNRITATVVPRQEDAMILYLDARKTRDRATIRRLPHKGKPRPRSPHGRRTPH
jgi:ubiquinone/menaquinone biosynthesis C-methylase UbiE